MFESFIVTLREGVEAALVVCIALAFLKKVGRADLIRSVYQGVGAATLVSIGGAAVIKLSGFDPENEIMEGVLFLASAVMVVTLLVWMWRAGKTLKHELEERLRTISAAGGARWSVFLFTFLMVGREGVETVLFLSAVDLTTSSLLGALGAVLGLAAAIGLGIAFYRGSLRIDLRKFFAVTSVALLIFAAQLLVGGIHEFMEAGLLPSSQRVMAIVGPLVKNSVVFVIALLVLPFALVMTSALRAQRPAPAAASNPAAQRKQLAASRGERLARFVFASLAIVTIVVVGLHDVYARTRLELTPPVMVQADGDHVTIPLAQIEESKLYRFGFDAGGKRVRFLVYRTRDRIGTGLDACEICADLGYVQEGEHVLCRNCLAEIYAPTIGQGGGCNPRALPYQRVGDDLRFRVTDLEAAAEFFHDEAPELTCPVCRMQFRKEEAGGHVERDGRTIYYCKMPGCAAQLERTR